MTTATKQDIPVPSAFLAFMESKYTSYHMALDAWRFLLTAPYAPGEQPYNKQFVQDLRAWKKQQKAARHA